MDHTYFFDPTNTLDPAELKFVLAVLKEKMKMLLDGNPDVASSISTVQLESLIRRVEDHDVTNLRKALQSKSDELVEERKRLREVELLGGATGRPKVVDFSQNGLCKIWRRRKRSNKCDTYSHQHFHRTGQISWIWPHNFGQPQNMGQHSL